MRSPKTARRCAASSGFSRVLAAEAELARIRRATVHGGGGTAAAARRRQAAAGVALTAAPRAPRW